MDNNTGFSVVEIPDKAPQALSAVAEALEKNIGKALELPLGNKDSSNFRKVLRSAVFHRGLLKKYEFKTRVITDRNVIIAWLAPKPEVIKAEERQDAPIGSLGDDSDPVVQ